MSFLKNLQVERQEEKDFVSEVYAGLAKLTPVVINPTMQQMHDILGMDYVNKEPVYKGENFDKEPVSYITIWCRNEENGFFVPVRFSISDRKVKKSSNGSVFICNKYGQFSYQTPENAKTLQAGTPIDGIKWYLPEGIRGAYEGEAAFNEFFRRYKNTYTINEKSTEEQKSKSAVQFDESDWKRLVALDKDALEEITTLFTEKGPDGESYFVGVLLGARTNDKGYLNQDVYVDMFVANYVVKAASKRENKGILALIKSVEDSQSAGKYKNTDFRLKDLELSLFSNETIQKDKTNKDDLFGDGLVDGVSSPEEDDDLEF